MSLQSITAQLEAEIKRPRRPTTPARKFVLALERLYDGETWAGDGVTCAYFDGGAYAECFPEGDAAINLRRVDVVKTARRQGSGNNLLRVFTGLADKLGVELRTSAQSLDPGAMDNSQLTAWYGRHGFLPSAENSRILVRPART